MLSASPVSARTRFTPRYQSDLLARNYGTGVRVGVLWGPMRTALRAGAAPWVYEVGAFHQIALGKAGSVQGEALLYRQPATAGAPVALGMRLPALLVLNPLDNFSLHAGLVLQWQWSGRRPTASSTPETLSQPVHTAPVLTVQMAAGAELRIECVRLGLRYSLPGQLITDLPKAGTQLADAWRTGQGQVYLGINL